MEKLRIANERLQTARNDHEAAYHAETENLSIKENELLQRLHSLDDKKLDISKVHGNTNISHDDIIEINAGGTIVTARRSILTQLKNTRLEALFNGHWDKELQRDVNGRIFLDVNAMGFQAIVDYLNELTISSLDDLPDIPSVDVEHEYILKHQLDLFGLADKMPPDSNIIKDASQATLLHNWLEEDGVDGVFRLLYRTSRDGETSQSFHAKCDNKGCTITIIETTDGHIIGGYSNTAWSSSTRWSGANKAFLFVLPDAASTPTSSPCKMKLKNPNDGRAVRHLADWGPIFGEGNHDLYVSVEASQVHTNFGNTYRYELGMPQMLHNRRASVEAIRGRESGGGGRVSPSEQQPFTGERRAYTIKEMEVFSVISTNNTDDLTTTVLQQTEHNSVPVTRFTKEINEAINAKRESLQQAELELINLEESFKDEQTFVTTFASGDAKDVIVLNVSGTIMAVKRSTLQIASDSVLAQQFDDTKWTEQGYTSSSSDSTSRVKDWTSDEVCTWIQSIPGMQEEVASIFKENKITGYELLALKKDGLLMLGITRPGTVCVLVDEIRKLDNASYDYVTLIEHSPYCFCKILDYLRLKQLHSHGLADEPALPTVCDNQKRRFEKVVKYYFPGDSAKFILGDK